MEYVKATFFAAILSCMMLPVCGRDFNTNWIYAPQSDSISHVWFRRAYLSHGKPRHATITVTSTGCYKLYVNECNVGTALFYPCRRQGNTTAIETTFDVTPYLRPDTNVVALLYSPTALTETRRQIAVNIYGSTRGDSAFCHVSDGSWLCRRANSHITNDGGEFVDGRGHDPSWKTATIYNTALWMHAETGNDYAETSLDYAETDNDGSKPQTPFSGNAAPFASHIYTFGSADVTYTEDDVAALQLANAIYGFPRATIREAKRGEKITIGNLQYICNGQIDEQAFPQFSLNTWRTILITGDKRFRTSQIMNLETVIVAQTR